MTHNRFTYENASFALKKSYNIEGAEYNEAWHNHVVIHHRKLSTYINTLIETNFIIEKVIDDVLLPTTITEDNSKWYSAQKATIIPATFIIKATKRGSCY